MQKGLILYMGYYGRYTAAYSIGCLLMLSLYIAGIFLHWAAFGVLLVLTLAGVMLLAVICSVLGARPRGDGGAVPLYEQARALAPQLWVAARAGAALNALHAQEAAQPSAGI